MRKIEIVYAGGNADVEKKVSDIIQQAVFTALNNERMDIRQYSNVQTGGTTAKRPQQVNEKPLEIPDFLKSEKTVGGAL